MKKSVFIIAMAIFCTLSVMAQNGVLKGKLTDKNTGEPLVGATIMVKGSTLGTITNYDGDYELTPIEPGLHTVCGRFYRLFKPGNGN